MFNMFETDGYPSLKLQYHITTSLTESQAAEVSILKWELLYHPYRYR